MALCDASSLQYVRFPPPRTSFFTLAASFTNRFVDPVIDPASHVVCIPVTLILLLVITIIVLVVLVVLVDILIIILIMGEQALENCKGIVIIISMLPLGSFG